MDWKHRLVGTIKRIRYKLGFLSQHRIEPEEAKSQSVIEPIRKSRSTSDKKKTKNTQLTATDATDVASNLSAAKCRKCGKEMRKLNKPQNLKGQNLAAYNQNQKLVSFSGTRPEANLVKGNKLTSNVRVIGDVIDPVDTVIFGTCYQIRKDEHGQEIWIETEKIKFSLEKMEWMKFLMSERTKRMFLSLLDLKINFKTSLSNLENNMNHLQNQLSILTEEVIKIKPPSKKTKQ